MKVLESSIGISNLTLHNKTRPFGPTLRFSWTMRMDLANGKTHAVTVPGFICRKLENGSYSIWPPVHSSTPGKTYFCAVITQDDIALILDKLKEHGFLTKVGTNNNPSNLLNLEPDLLSEFPTNITFY